MGSVNKEAPLRVTYLQLEVGISALETPFDLPDLSLPAQGVIPTQLTAWTDVKRSIFLSVCYLRHFAFIVYYIAI